MYKMTVFSLWGHGIGWSRILQCDDYKEVVALALEKLKYALGFEKLSLTWVQKGKYKILMRDKFVGELKLKRIVGARK